MKRQTNTVLKEKSTKKVMPYLIPGLITMVVMLVILICKGIWPFGTNRIDYFDNMQQVAPLYAHLWDWMHGKASLWFDWYTGLGTNVSMSISAFSMLSPFAFKYSFYTACRGKTRNLYVRFYEHFRLL